MLLALAALSTACRIGDAAPGPPRCVSDDECESFQVCVPIEAELRADAAASAAAAVADNLDANTDAMEARDAAGAIEGMDGGDAGVPPGVEDGAAGAAVTEWRGWQPRGCECRSDRCGSPGLACSRQGPDGMCVPVGCLSDGDCGRFGVQCIGMQCVDMLGQCSTPDDCDLAEEILEVLPPSCAGRRCRISSPKVFAQALRLELNSLPAERRLRHPAAWDAFREGQEIELSWDQPAKDSWSLVVVTRRPELDPLRLSQETIWHAYAGADDCNAGVCAQKVSQGIFDSAPHDGGLLPGIYYAAVIYMVDGTPEAASDYAPFQVGAGWPSVGASCTASYEVHGVTAALEACWNPDLPLLCRRERCYELCGSSEDCSENLAASVLCGPRDPQTRIRVCPLP